MQGHKNAKEATKKLQDYKRKIGKILSVILYNESISIFTAFAFQFNFTLVKQ